MNQDRWQIYHSDDNPHSLDIERFYNAHEHQVATTQKPRTSLAHDPYFNKLQPFFGWISPDNIKKTFHHTMQLACITTGTLFKKVYKSQNPALNVIQRGEPVATNDLYSDTPAIDNNSTRCQIFVGMNTDVVDIYPMKFLKQFVNTLEDKVRFGGAPTKLVSDRAQVEISNRALEGLPVYGISAWQSEPHQQHQNYAEHKIQQLKQMTNIILDCTGAPSSIWLLALMYVAFVLNHTWSALTWKILNVETNKVLYCSLCHPVTGDTANLHLAPIGRESASVRPYIKSKTFDSNLVDATNEPDSHVDDTAPIEHGEFTPDPESQDTSNSANALVSLDDLVGRTFLMDPDSSGQRFCARIVEMIDKHDHDITNHPEWIKFLCKPDQNDREELISYNQIMEYLNQDAKNPTVWKYKGIISHQGPLKSGDKDYKGSTYNIMIKWECGEITNEPLKLIAKDDSVTCAIYPSKNNLLDTDGWQRFKSIAQRQKKFIHMAKQAYLWSFCSSPKYKYRIEVA